MAQNQVNQVNQVGQAQQGGYQQQQQPQQQQQQGNNVGRNEYREHHASYVVFVSEPTDRQSRRRREMEVNAVMPAVPNFMYWSEQEITWSREDHPKIMPNPGGYALVIDPIFTGPESNVKFSRVLVDNGSSINILYKDTMYKLGVDEYMLLPTSTTFHGIVLGLSCNAMGKLWVDMCLGTKENCRVEHICFEVVDLVSPYHALLGRPALAKFMASTHVGYLKMKLPGPNGVITISGSYKRAMECASDGSRMAEAMVIAHEKEQMMETVAMAQNIAVDLPALASQQGGASFAPTQEVKKVFLNPEHPERALLIGAGLTEK
jgi:hypothetical protein